MPKVCSSSNRVNRSVELLKTGIVIDEIGLPKLKGKTSTRKRTPLLIVVYPFKRDWAENGR